MMILLVIPSCGGPSDKSNGYCFYGRLDEYCVRRAHISVCKVIGEIVAIGRKTSDVFYRIHVRRPSTSVRKRPVKGPCTSKKRPSRNVIIIHSVKRGLLFFFFFFWIFSPTGENNHRNTAERVIVEKLIALNTASRVHAPQLRPRRPPPVSPVWYRISRVGDYYISRCSYFRFRSIL